MSAAINNEITINFFFNLFVFCLVYINIKTALGYFQNKKHEKNLNNL